MPPKEIISIIGRKTSALNALIGWSERIGAFTNISTILRGAGIQTETTLEKLLETVETQKETLDKLDNLVRHSWRGPAFGSLSAMLSGAGSRGPAALNDVIEILAGKMDLLSKLEKLVGSGKGHSAFSSIARIFYSAGATTPERLPGFLNVLEKREAALVELVGPGKMFPDFGRFLSNLPEGRGGAAHRLEKLIVSSLPSASKSAVPSDKTGTF